MPAIVYHFSEQGAKAVEAAFKSIEAKAAAAEKAQRETARSASKTSSIQYGPTRQTMYAKQASEEKALARRRLDDQKALQRAEQKASNERTRMGRRAAIDEARRQRDLDRARVEANKRQEHERAKAERDHRRRQEKTIQQAQASQSRMRSTAAGMAMGAGRWAMGGIAGMGAAGVGIAGMALRKTFSLQELASKVSTQSRQKGEKAVDPSVLRREWENAAISAPGATAEGVGSAVQQIVTRTGEFGIARSWEKELATIMAATDVEGAALGDALSTMFQKFDIKSVDQMREAVASMVMQGKKGAFELSDAAQFMGEVGAAAARFGGSMQGPEGLKTLGGMMQIARQSTGSGAEASTAVETMFRQLVSASDEIKKKTKVDVFKDKGKTQTNDFMELIPKIIAGAKGNQSTLQGIFDARGIRAVSPLIGEYNKAVDEARKAGLKDKEVQAKGMAAVSAMMKDAIETGSSWDDVLTDAADRAKSSGNKLSASWEIVSSTIGGKVEPAFAGLVGKLADWVSRDDVQLAIGELAAAIAYGAEDLGSAFGWLMDKLIALGLVDQNDVSQKKAERAMAKAKSDVMAYNPSDEETAALQTLYKTYAGEEGMTQEVFQRMAETEGVRGKLAATYYKGAKITEAAQGVTMGGRADAISAAPTGEGGIAGSIAGALFGLPGMIIGGRFGEKQEAQNLATPAQRKAQAQQQADIDAAAARLEALTSAAQNATKALNGLEARPSIWPF